MLPTILSLGPIVISSFGVLLVVAFFTGAFVVWKRGKEEHFEEEDLFDATLLSTFWGLLGARAWYVAFNFDKFGLDPLKIIALTRFPGLTLLGAIFVGILTLTLFSRRKKWGSFATLDLFSLGLAFALVIGFLGAFLNGSGYGTRTNIPWAVVFPGVEGARHPTQIYGVIWFLLLFILLRKLFFEYRTYEWYKGNLSEAKAGLVFFGFLVGFGLSEFFLTMLTPAKLYLGGLAFESWIGLLIFASGGLGLYARSGRVLREDLVAFIKSVKSGIKGIVRIVSSPFGNRKRAGRKKRDERFTAGLDATQKD